MNPFGWLTNPIERNTTDLTDNNENRRRTIDNVSSSSSIQPQLQLHESIPTSLPSLLPSIIPLPPATTTSNPTITSPTSFSSTPSAVRIQLWEPGLPRSSCCHYRPWSSGTATPSPSNQYPPLSLSPTRSTPTSPSQAPGSADESTTAMRDLSPVRQYRSLSYPNHRHGNTTTNDALLHPISRYQIVLYKDSTMVVYNLDNRRIEARTLTTVEENTIRAHRMSFCPMCGQVIDPSRFSFQAQSYFRILQDLFRARYSSSSANSSHDYNQADPSNGSTIPPPRHRGLSDIGSTPPILSSEAADKGNPFVVSPASSSPPRSTTTTGHDGSPTPLEQSSSSVDDEEIPIPRNLSKELFVTGYYKNFFREIRRLGSGSFGQVFLCHHILDDVYLGEYAVKKVPVGDDKRWLQKMLREVKIRERLHNANVVEYKHSWLEMHRTALNLPIIPWLFLLMEFCNGGDLDSFLSSNQFTLPIIDVVSTATPVQPSIDQSEPLMPMKESHIWKLFFDLANGLNHLHHSGILHRDLKPQNILLQCTLDTLTNTPTTSALLADFGTSEHFNERACHARRQGFTGTVEFTAPELLETDEAGAFRVDYDEKSDIWSLGVVLYVLAYGRVPYCHDDPTNVRLKILGHTDPHLIIPQIPERSSDLVLLIEALLQRDPNSRPSLDAVLAHRRIFKRLTDAEGVAEAGREISYLLPFFRAQHVPANSSHLHRGSNIPNISRNDRQNHQAYGHPPLLLGSDSIDNWGAAASTLSTSPQR